MSKYPDDVLIAAREAAAGYLHSKGDPESRQKAFAISGGKIDRADLVQSAARAIMQERERCARVAEGWPIQCGDIEYQTNGGRFWDAGTLYDQARVDVAADIRLPQAKVWPGPGEAPHVYVPDHEAGGTDCRICGHPSHAHKETER